MQYPPMQGERAPLPASVVGDWGVREVCGEISTARAQPPQVPQRQ